MKRKLTSLALVSAGLLAVALPGVSHAYVMGSAMLNMTNFEILGSNGVRLDAGDFSFLTYTITADQDATLNGVTLSNTDSGVTAIDFAPICVGAGCNPILPNNSFPSLTAPPATGNYAAADQLDEGSPITGTPLGDDKSHVAAGSYTGLDTGNAVSSVDANNNFNSSFIFELNQAQGVTFTFDLQAWLQVAVSSDEFFPGFATAAVDMNFTLIDLGTGDTVFNYSPDIFGDGVKTLSLNAPLPINVQLCRDTFGNANDCVQGAAKSFSSTTVALAAGNLYQASFRLNTNADAARVVPEPGILALVGMGLLGLGLSRRRKLAA